MPRNVVVSRHLGGFTGCKGGLQLRGFGGGGGGIIHEADGGCLRCVTLARQGDLLRPWDVWSKDDALVEQEHLRCG